MGHRHKLLSATLPGAALLGACAICTPAWALQWDFDNGFNLSVDTTLAYGAQWRTEGRDPLLSYDNSEDEAIFNTNDGNNNFDPGLVSSRGSIILEVGGIYNNVSFFIRGDAMYDSVYVHQITDISDSNYLTYNSGIPVGGSVKQGDFPQGTIDENGKRVRLLDAFVTYSFNAGNQGGSVRLGRQVISWGEATFYQGVNQLQNPIDAVAAQAPGTEAREIFLPTAAVDLKWDFNASFSAEVYYKLWEASTLPGVGSYWSTRDVVGPGADKILLDPLPPGNKAKAVEPDEGGQWGIAGRYMTENGTNFELYYVRAHSNLPGSEVKIDLTGGSYFREVYTEGIDTYAGSFSTTLGEAQVYADIAYSPNMPIVDFNRRFLDDGTILNSDVDLAHNWQVVAGFTDGYTAFPWLSEQIILLGEVTYQHNNLGESDLDTSGLKATAEAWGYQLRAILSYFAVLPGMDLQVPVFFKHDAGGHGNAIGYNGLTNNLKTASLGVDAFYLTNWQFALKYAWFWGSDPENLTRDRDNIAITAKYIF